MVKNPLYKFKETRYNKENIGQEGCPMARMGFIQDKLEITQITVSNIQMLGCIA